MARIRSDQETSNRQRATRSERINPSNQLDSSVLNELNSFCFAAWITRREEPGSTEIGSMTGNEMHRIIWYSIHIFGHLVGCLAGCDYVRRPWVRPRIRTRGRRALTVTCADGSLTSDQRMLISVIRGPFAPEFGVHAVKTELNRMNE